MNSSKAKNERWVVPEEFLSGMIINRRFKVGDFLGGGYTGFVRNGMWMWSAYFLWQNFNEMTFFDKISRSYSGTDLETGKSVAIKFAREELFHSLETEYKNYLQLGADGMNSCDFLRIFHSTRFNQFSRLNLFSF